MLTEYLLILRELTESKTIIVLHTDTCSKAGKAPVKEEAKGVGRGEGGAGEGPGPPIILEGGGQHTLSLLPNNPTTFSFNTN